MLEGIYSKEREIYTEGKGDGFYNYPREYVDTGKYNGLFHCRGIIKQIGFRKVEIKITLSKKLYTVSNEFTKAVKCKIL